MIGRSSVCAVLLLGWTLAVPPTWGAETMSDSEAELVKGSASVIGKECVHSTCEQTWAASPCHPILILYCRETHPIVGRQDGRCVDPGHYSEERCRIFGIHCFDDLRADFLPDGSCPDQCNQPDVGGDNGTNCDRGVEV